MRIPVEYGATIYTTKVGPLTIPFRYIVALDVNGIETGIGTSVWGYSNAQQTADHLSQHGEDLLASESSSKRQAIYAEIQAAYVARLNQQLSEKLVPGDRVKLAVDIGHMKAGRIAKVVKTYTKEDGTDGIVDARWPISVEVLPVAGDPAAWAHGAPVLLLERGEFCSLDTEL
jgi:hypothetical protein